MVTHVLYTAKNVICKKEILFKLTNRVDYFFFFFQSRNINYFMLFPLKYQMTIYLVNV